MAQAFYITAQGQKQGAIKGDVTQKGHEGAILRLSKLQEYNDVSFTYQKITTTFAVGGIIATDDWQTHV